MAPTPPHGGVGAAFSCHNDVVTEEEPTDDDSSAAGKFGYFAGIVVGGVLFIGAACVATLLFGLVGWAAFEVVFDHERAFRVIGENIAPFGAWIAAIVAACSVAVLAFTNRSRARESTNNDFREFMQWALENLNQDDDLTTRLFAYQVIAEFAENPPKLLDERNRQLAQLVYFQVTAENASVDIDPEVSMEENDETSNSPAEGGSRAEEEGADSN